MRKDQRIGARGDRESAVRGFEMKIPFIADEFELARFKDLAELISKYRKEDLVGEIGFEWHPVDVEVTGVRGTGAVFENIVPPEVFTSGNAHVVGDDIENEAHLS